MTLARKGLLIISATLLPVILVSLCIALGHQSDGGESVAETGAAEHLANHDALPEPVHIEVAVPNSHAPIIDEQRLNEWSRSKGYFLPGDHGDYVLIDTDGLLMMARGGDAKALNVLAMRLAVESEKSPDNLIKDVEELLNREAVHGSLGAIQALVSLTQREVRFADTKQNKRAFRIKEIAYGLVHEQRMAFDAYPFPRSVRENVYDKELLENAEILASRLYASWQAERHAMGIGAFDNSVPDDVEQMTAQYTGSLKQSGGPDQ